MTITAKIILDSTSPENIRLTTFELRYPRLIHSEFMTHRVFSRNASSSRAIPITKLIDDVLNDTAMPSSWGKNGKGMQDHGEMSEGAKQKAKDLWLKARDKAVKVAKEMLELEEVPHKQIVNRLLEPFSHINVLVTATNFDNFFWLRRHKDADPTIKELADKMWDKYIESVPHFRDFKQWHLPYIDQEDISNLMKMGITNTDVILENLLKISVARCARVSYKTRDNKPTDFEKDLELYKSLVVSEPLHASPAEHQATPDWYYNKTIDAVNWLHPEKHGNLEGWIQYRKTLPKEYNKNYKGE